MKYQQPKLETYRLEAKYVLQATNETYSKGSNNWTNDDENFFNN